MADNAFLDATEYAKVMLLLVKNNLVLGRLVNGMFSNEVTDENGLVINVKRPPMFVSQDGEALALQSVINGSVPLSVDTYKNVHIDVGDLEQIQSYNQLVENETMKAAASELAHTIDSSVHALLAEVSNEVGTPGDVIGTPAEFNKVHTRLMDGAVPNSDLSAVVGFQDGEEIRGSLIGGNIDGINRSALERVRIPLLSEIDVFATNNIGSLTSGTRNATSGLINGANQHVNYRDVKDTNQQTLLVDTLGATETVTRGDIFTIAGVLAVNPRSRTPHTYLKQFVVLADATAAAGAISLTISPPIIVPGTTDGFSTITNTAFQTVDSIPADGAAITFHTAPSAVKPIKVAFHKRAISLVSAKLRLPFGDPASFISDPETGIGIRYWRGSNITTGRHIHRWDTVYGTQFMQRELASRVNGTP